jgi:hypothetical protein
LLDVAEDVAELLLEEGFFLRSEAEPGESGDVGHIDGGGFHGERF